jgi:hypothetical protein
LTAGAPQSRPESDAAAHFRRNAEEKRGKNTFCAAFLFPLLYCSPGISQETKHFFRGSAEFPHVYIRRALKKRAAIYTALELKYTHCAVSRVHLKSESAAHQPRVKICPSLNLRVKEKSLRFCIQAAWCLRKEASWRRGALGAEQSFELAYLPI